MMRLLSAGLIAIGLAISPYAGTPVHAQGQTLVYTQGVPLYPATMDRPIVATLRIAGVKLSATVKNLPARMPGETPAQASVRKANAIVNAINTEIGAKIAAGLLPAGTPLATVTLEPATIQVKDRFGRPLFRDAFGRPTLVNTSVPFMVPNDLAGFGIVTVPGVTELIARESRDPTGQPVGARLLPPPGPGPGPGPGTPTTPASGSMGSPSPGSGISMGLQPDGTPSWVSFGVLEDIGFDADCASELPPVSACPGAFIATLFPAAGLTSGEVLGQLAALFNSLFRADGFTVTYDPMEDLLSLDQPLTPFLRLFMQNTDPGLELALGLAVVPEPAALALLGAGLLGLAALRALGRRRA
jgi:hypothetical protein